VSVCSSRSCSRQRHYASRRRPDPLSSRARKITFAGIVVAAAVVAAGFIGWSAFGSEAKEPPPVAAGTVREALERKPVVVYQHVKRDDHYAEIAIAPVDAPTSKTFTGLVCERVHFAFDRGLCLMPRQNVLGQAVNARIFGTDFRPVASVRLEGLQSRTRVSAKGRYGAATTFVTGHSYLDSGFSTHTALIDLRRNAILTDLEKFTVTREGEPFKAIDFNFWGVTFTRDERRFYATLSTGGKIYLIEGDVHTRRAKVVAEGVECPALSPDETRVAYKSRTGDGWRLHVLDLESGKKTALAETRSVDDQVEWLDDDRILYGYISDIWVVPADGGGEPEIFVRDALSPAVVRA
jgi:hypothetical protein